MKIKALIVIVVLILVAAVVYTVNKTLVTCCSAPDFSDYNPTINPTDFTTDITNPFFTLKPGTKTVYEAIKEDGKERIEFYVTYETKTVLGVETVVVWDRVWLDGDLIEDTKDWFAQDKAGNVWYFGEESYEMIDGKIINNHGSWEAGADGAKPGIIMPANPQVGNSYREEYYAGEAEDMADVLSITETVNVPAGNYTNCLKTKNYTPLDPGAVENKYYCKEVGATVLEVDPDGGERTELISIEYNVEPSPNKEAVTESSTNNSGATSNATVETPEQLVTQISEEQAEAIALKQVPGKVTDIAIEKKFGKITYVVEVKPNYGSEKDVIIDVNTGEVLGVE